MTNANSFSSTQKNITKNLSDWERQRITFANQLFRMIRFFLLLETWHVHKNLNTFGSSEKRFGNKNIRWHVSNLFFVVFFSDFLLNSFVHEFSCNFFLIKISSAPKHTSPIYLILFFVIRRHSKRKKINNNKKIANKKLLGSKKRARLHVSTEAERMNSVLADRHRCTAPSTACVLPILLRILKMVRNKYFYGFVAVVCISTEVNGIISEIGRTIYTRLWHGRFVNVNHVRRRNTHFFSLHSNFRLFRPFESEEWRKKRWNFVRVKRKRIKNIWCETIACTHDNIDARWLKMRFCRHVSLLSLFLSLSNSSYVRFVRHFYLLSSVSPKSYCLIVKSNIKCDQKNTPVWRKQKVCKRHLLQQPTTKWNVNRQKLKWLSYK